ncbi:MAG: zf-TFIIB domain-containing protein [Elusimicrobiota bacterium]
MNRKMFKSISGVVIDICADHGIWLDPGELEQIRSFIADGGLEKYQEHMDKKIEYNHTEIKKLARETDNIRFIQKMMHLYSPRFWFLKLLF